MSKTGGPAFPVSLTNEQETRWDSAGLGCANGMTLRDYFAAKAMQAAITGCATRSEVGLYSDWAGFAYEMADAMLKAREQ
jgi:hypothetical protein